MLETEKSNLKKVIFQYSIDVRKIFDCGSRDALDGIELAELFDAEEVHFFECNPFSIKVCKRNIEKKSGAPFKMKLHELALGDKEGEVSFFAIDPQKTVTPHPGGNVGASSLFLASEVYKKERYVQNEIKVPMSTLTAVNGNSPAPDLIWMDLQGAELMALKGFESKLADVSAIHVEVGFRAVYKGQPLFRDVDQYLSRNFSLKYISLGRWPRIVWLYNLLGFGPWIANAIYVNKKLSRRA